MNKNQRIENLTKQVVKGLIFKHKTYLFLINKSAIMKYALKDKFATQNSGKQKESDYELKILMKEVLNLNTENIENNWTKNVVKEIQGIDKLPIDKKNNFQVFLYLCSIFVGLERNQQIHNKAKYDLKDILLSEIVDSIISTAVQNISYEFKKIIKIKIVKIIIS